MTTNPIPSHLIGPMRVASKAGFLTRRVYDDFFVTNLERSWRYRRWHSLTESGYFAPARHYGFPKTTVTLTQKGKARALELGMNPVFVPPARNIWHDEELVRLALFLERQGWLSNWMTEQELNATGLGKRFFEDQVRAARTPDLILQWNTNPERVLWAVELERTRKPFNRYYDLVGAYKGVSFIDSVFIIAAASSIEANIKKALVKKEYPQARRPVVFASLDQLIQNPLACELRSGANRKTLKELATSLTNKKPLEPELFLKTVSNIGSTNVASASETA